MTQSKETKVIERSLGAYLAKHDELIAQGYKVVESTCYKSVTGLQASYIKLEEPAVKPATKPKRTTKKVVEKEAEE